MKSSSPCPGAVCTKPVPASSVTCSPKITGETLSKNTCLYVTPSKSRPEIFPTTS